VVFCEYAPMALSKEDIISQIRAAFLGVKRPSDEKLLHFPNTGGELWAESFLGNTSTDWIDISPQKIEYECSALTVFSPSAFVYYLPAYMTWVLNHYETSSSNTLDHTLYDLDLTNRDDTSRRIIEERFSALSQQQGQAVLTFLKFMREIPRVDSKAASSAIDSYWSRFDEPTPNSLLNPDAKKTGAG
jgi:hypothetical protein